MVFYAISLDYGELASLILFIKPQPIKAWVIGIPCTVWAAAGTMGDIKLVGAPQPKPMPKPNFQDMFTPIGSRADLIFGEFAPTTVAIVPDFSVLRFVGVPQFEPVHRLSPNFQDMLTAIGSTADLLLKVICQQPLPWQCFKYFSVLILIEKGPLLN